MLVGRDGELEWLEAELARPDRVAGAYVHGPAGIGKTALLRAAGARAAAAFGYELVWIDGRDIAPVPDQLEDAIGSPGEAGRPLVVIDSFEHVEALGGYLRRVLVPALPPGGAVLIASRRAPGPEWAAREEARFRPLALAPLDRVASTEVLRRHGLGADAAERA
ncbi:MAG TPA: AAA family ATPase, partial [Solirubrobacterales bacterium]|nr:AAA family ATPase [Solirubrobacterales bacterium]